MLDGAIAGFPATYAEKVGKTSDDMCPFARTRALARHGPLSPPVLQREVQSALPILPRADASLNHFAPAGALHAWAKVLLCVHEHAVLVCLPALCVSAVQR